MKVYLAGPMRGVPAYNFPAFYEAEHYLANHVCGADFRKDEVFNPARNDVEHYNLMHMTPAAAGQWLLDNPQEFDLRRALGEDLAWIAEHADAVCVLPGWENSKGACAEVALARALGLLVWAYDPGRMPGYRMSVVPDSAEEPVLDEWAAERQDVLDRFAAELSKATGDGSKKRQAGEKPPWYRDTSHEGAIFSHITKWKRGEQVDPDSGAHPLVHAGWRCLAIAASENGNNPDGDAEARKPWPREDPEMTRRAEEAQKQVTGSLHYYWCQSWSFPGCCDCRS